MAKYRLLQNDELKALEKEFIEYLVVNGITAQDWQKIKTENPSEADKVIALFSDVVFEKIMRQSAFIEYQSEDSFFCFHYQSKEAILVGIKSKDGPLSLEGDITSKIKDGTYELIRGKKGYSQQRELELFEMTQKGAQITDGTWYKKLATLV